MFERTKTRDEEHVDERARSFFSYGYTGKEGGYSHTWNSLAEGIRPTTVIQSDSGMSGVCAYCGRVALPIQGRRAGYSRMGEDTYYDKGKCCVCKDAMDELEMQDQIDEITKQFKAALRCCREAMPKKNPDVLLAMMDNRLKESKKDLGFHLRDGDLPDYAVERAGFKLVRPTDWAYED